MVAGWLHGLAGFGMPGNKFWAQGPGHSSHSFTQTTMMRRGQTSVHPKRSSAMPQGAEKGLRIIRPSKQVDLLRRVLPTSMSCHSWLMRF